MLTAALSATSERRDDAITAETEAYAMVDELQFEAALSRERNERIFHRSKMRLPCRWRPLDEMFSSTGLRTDQIISSRCGRDMTARAAR